jgi:hypothetical protein
LNVCIDFFSYRVYHSFNTAVRPLKQNNQSNKNGYIYIQTVEISVGSCRSPNNSHGFSMGIVSLFEIKKCSKKKIYYVFTNAVTLLNETEKRKRKRGENNKNAVQEGQSVCWY